MIAARVLTVPGLGNNVTKPELGTKRLCAGCNAKFYDLLKTPDRLPDVRGGVRRAEARALAAAARLRATARGGPVVVAP